MAGFIARGFAGAAAGRDDPELQDALARDGLTGLDRLLTTQAHDMRVPVREVGALVRLICQAFGEAEAGDAV